MFKFTIIGILATIFFVAYLITESIRRKQEGRYVPLIKRIRFWRLFELIVLASLVLFVLSLFSGGLVILFVFTALGLVFTEISPFVVILLLVIADFSIFIIEGLIRKDLPDAKLALGCFLIPKRGGKSGGISTRQNIFHCVFSGGSHPERVFFLHADLATDVFAAEIFVPAEASWRRRCHLFADWHCLRWRAN